MYTMTHLSLFSGVGGLDIAAEWAFPIFRAIAEIERMIEDGK